MIGFRIMIEPRSLQQGAHRQAARVDGNGRAFVHHYSTREAESFKRSIAVLVAPHRPIQPLDGPLRTEFRFILARPQYLCRRNSPAGRIHCWKKPDYVNLAKHFEDVLTKCGFWHDDGQLADARNQKFYAAVGEQPCIEVCIAPVTAQQPQLFRS